MHTTAFNNEIKNAHPHKTSLKTLSSVMEVKLLGGAKAFMSWLATAHTD